MPIYEYICMDCRARFESLRPMKDADAPITCAECESDHTSRMLAVLVASHGRNKDASGSYPAAASTRSGCAGCSGGSCSTCG